MLRNYGSMKDFVVEIIMFSLWHCWCWWYYVHSWSFRGGFVRHWSPLVVICEKHKNTFATEVICGARPRYKSTKTTTTTKYWSLSLIFPLYAKRIFFRILSIFIILFFNRVFEKCLYFVLDFNCVADFFVFALLADKKWLRKFC